MGLGSPTKRDSLLAESRNMSALGGADHGRAERWSELKLPLADFMMRARHVLRRSDTYTDYDPNKRRASYFGTVVPALCRILNYHTVAAASLTSEYTWLGSLV